MTDEHVSARGRVRELFLTPLSESGFRSKKGTSPAAAEKALARMASGLAYLSDAGLRALRASMETKGEGAARCFWPTYATVIGFAEAFEPRPLEDVPELARWFASAAGRAAQDDDRLVAEFEFWRRLKRPPYSPQDQAKVAARATEWRDRAARIRDRLDRGLSGHGDDAQWLAWYDQTLARAQALVAAGPGGSDAGRAA